LHFGLGGAQEASSVEIRWPSGKVETLRNIQPGQVLKIREK
jgi:hypothetical protein